MIGALLSTQLLLVGMKYPAPLYSPGDIVEAHSKLRCKDCHAPFKKVPSESCSTARCHPDDKIGKKPVIRDLHDRMKGKDCLICHTDHLGPNGRITKGVDHESFLKGTNCSDCHIGEGDTAHKERYSGDCSACHSTNKWKEVIFDHSRKLARPCLDCHKGPKDELHMGLSESCGDCHTTKAWKPATYNHEKYFFLDEQHKVSCNKCHDTGSHKRYTCLNCHEHAGGKIDREHWEEGIKNYGDCLRCHQVNIGGRSYGKDKVHEGIVGDDK